MLFVWIELIYIKYIWHIKELYMLVVSVITNTELDHATNCNRQTLKYHDLTRQKFISSIPKSTWVF